MAKSGRSGRLRRPICPGRLRRTRPATQIRLLRGGCRGTTPASQAGAATGLKQPYGINFYPSGANPQWVYIGNTNSIVRFAYKNGDLKSSGAPEIVGKEVPEGGGHWTRDLVFSKDGSAMFVAAASGSNC